MNAPKLPPLPKPDTHCFDDDTGKDVWSHSPAQMQAYAIAAIEAQGVPMVADFNQLQAMQAEWHAVSHDNSITSEAKFQRVYKAAMRACATPTPQTSVVQPEPVAWLHPTNATCVTTDPTAYARGIPLYTHPSQQAKPQPLSDTLHDDIQSVLFEVEQAIENGCCPWQIEAAFEAYEAARRLQQPGHGIKE